MTQQPASAEGRDDTAPPQYVGLLTQVMTNTLDADYEQVGRQPAGAGPRPAKTSAGVFAALTVFGLLVGMSALKTEHDRPAANAERAELIDQIHAREDRLDDLHGQLTSLQAAVTGLQTTLTRDALDDEELSGELTLLGVDSGAIAVTGPGVSITANDGASDVGPGGKILDVDLQALVNGLWEAGAEAIAIDGHRLTTLTSIGFAGEAITVDDASLTLPYVIEAIGDPATLPGRLLQTDGGQTWLGLRANFGITFDVTNKDSLTVPALPHGYLLYATAEEGAS